MKLRTPTIHLLNADDELTRSILIRITYILMAAYFFMFIIGLIYSDHGLTTFALAASILLTLPLFLLQRRLLRVGGFSVIMIALVSVAILCTFGQGIHDLGIMGFPAIIIIASLFMNKTDFQVTFLLTVAAAGWLVFGDKFGLYKTIPNDPPGLVDFIIVTTILLVTTLAISMLSNNMRENMQQARQEIIQRKNIQAELLHQSTHDALTGIYNRTFFEQELTRLEKEGNFPISILVSDADNLKITNDRLGHATGDELLRQGASLLRSVFRSKDVLARIGGDEFAVILPETDATTVQQLLERAQARLDEHNNQFPDLAIHLSIGVATAENSKLIEAFNLADQNMYAEKTQRKAAQKVNF
jgi:diguanylate cyclase (GGDEF)-like protein